MTVGDRVKECRLIMGYSAEQIAERLGISAATVYRYENGDITKMPAYLLEPLARILSTTPGYLMGWSSEGAPSPIQKLSPEETELLVAYRAADDRARADALVTLLQHPAAK